MRAYAHDVHVLCQSMCMCRATSTHPPSPRRDASTTGPTPVPVHRESTRLAFPALTLRSIRRTAGLGHHDVSSGTYQSTLRYPLPLTSKPCLQYRLDDLCDPPGSLVLLCLDQLPRPSSDMRDDSCAATPREPGPIPGSLGFVPLVKSAAEEQWRARLEHVRDLDEEDLVPRHGSEAGEQRLERGLGVAVARRGVVAVCRGESALGRVDTEAEVGVVLARGSAGSTGLELTRVE
jgi:hypothetical protein